MRRQLRHLSKPGDKVSWWKKFLPFKKHQPLPTGIQSLRKILSTVWPRLTRVQRLILIGGFFSALLHAAATPVFAWVFSKLLATFYISEGQSSAARIWSLAVLGVAFVDSIASYLMHYLLEISGQAWVDSLRTDAMKRILDQPRSWFIGTKTTSLTSTNVWIATRKRCGIWLADLLGLSLWQRP